MITYRCNNFWFWLWRHCPSVCPTQHHRTTHAKGTLNSVEPLLPRAFVRWEVTRPIMFQEIKILIQQNKKSIYIFIEYVYKRQGNGKKKKRKRQSRRRISKVQRERERLLESTSKQTKYE